MRVKCKNCGTDVDKAQPSMVTSALLTAALITGSFFFYFVKVIVGFLVRVFGEHRGDWFVGTLLFLFAGSTWFVLSWFFLEILRGQFSRRYRLELCPRCGAQNWDRPRYSGRDV